MIYTCGEHFDKDLLDVCLLDLLDGQLDLLSLDPGLLFLVNLGRHPRR